MSGGGELNNSNTIEGGTDGTVIGNSSDRLKVDAAFTSISTAMATTLNSKLRYIDMNASNGGVARNTTIGTSSWVDIFSYTGSGVVVTWVANLANGTGWLVRFLVDGEEIFGSAGILASDVNGASEYRLNTSGTATDDAMFGMSFSSDDRFLWCGPLQTLVRFSTSVSIKLKRVSSNGTYQAGLIVIQKDT